MTPQEIKQTRLDLKLTQKEMAAKIGCSYRSIQNWEGTGKNARKPSEIVLRAIRRISK